jgi:hypothetical protein
MFLRNNDKREHAVFSCGFTYTVPRGKTVDIPDGIAQKMMRRFPKLEIVEKACDIESDLEMDELEKAIEQEMEGAEDDEIEV